MTQPNNGNGYGYRIVSDHEMNDDNGDTPVFTTKAAARRWALKKLEVEGVVVIDKMPVDPK